MATQYEERSGGYSAAMSLLLEKGGQLYSGDSKDGCHTVVRGCYVTRFWEGDSAKKGKLIEACNTFGYEAYGMTGGSLCRKIIDDLLELPYKKTSFSNCYRDIAVKGLHWHYQHINTGDNGKCIEYDLSSAYMTQFLRLPSMILLGKDQFVDDGGAMERLRELMTLFPKWLRVQFLGVLASHNRTTITRVMVDGEWTVKKTVTPSINYGGAFNAAHRAILRVYRLMERVHKMAGDYCIRVHTDSFTLKSSTPRELLSSIFNHLEENEQPLQIKGIGRAFFFDLNEGLIGSKIIGAKPLVGAQLHDIGFKQDREPTDNHIEQTWEGIIEDIKEGMNRRKSIPISYEQCKIVWQRMEEKRLPDYGELF